MRAHLHPARLRTARVGLALATALMLAIPPAPVAAAATGPTWSIAQVSADGFDPSFVIDATGRRHIAMATRAGAVVYLTSSGSTWTRKTIAALGSSPVLAVDGHGKVHVAYIAANGGLPGIYYATNMTGAWASVRLSSASGDTAPSIAVDPDGEAHVAFQRNDFPEDDAGIGYATNRRGFWQTLRLSKVRDVTPSIALDVNRRVHIAFQRLPLNAVLGLGIRELTDENGLAWTDKAVTTNAYDTGPSLALTPSGVLGLAFSRGDPAGAGLFLARRSAGVWTAAKVAAATGAPQLVWDAAGHAAIAAGGDTYAAPYLITNASGAWVRTQLPVAGLHPSIAIDGSGRPVIATTTDVYNCSGCSDGAIMVQTRDGPSWSSSVVSYNMLDGASDLAVDAAGKIHMAIVRVYAGAPGIIYTTNASGAWATVRATSGEDTSASLAVDGAGHAHIAYIRYVYPGQYHLWYATNATGAWVGTELAAAANGGASVAVDAAGHAWVVWSDGGSVLRYRTNATGVWAAAARVGTASGIYPDAVLDAAGKLHVADRDLLSGKVAYTTNASGAWVRTFVGGAIPNDGYHPVRIAVDGSAKVRIAYSNGSVPRVVSNVTGAWVGSPATEIAGFVTSIALDSAGRSHVSLRGNAQVFDYTDASGTWLVRQTVAGEGPVFAVAPNGVVWLAYTANSQVQLAHN